VPTPQSDLLQGTLEVLILKALALQELHGMGISRRISQMTDGAFDVKAGSLFPALHRMEQAGWLKSFWGESETRRRAKFYSLTKAGRMQLHAETQRWERISLAMATALGTRQEAL
jgi:PadR family transcriptional regulator, regulatory protein PadR